METGLGLWVGVRACVTAESLTRNLGGGGGYRSCCVAVLGRASCDPLCVLVGQCKGRVGSRSRTLMGLFRSLASSPVVVRVHADGQMLGRPSLLAAQ